MKGVQCYELFGGIALKNHAFLIYNNTLKNSYDGNTVLGGAITNVKNTEFYTLGTKNNSNNNNVDDKFSTVEKTNQYCDFLRTVLDRHAPHSPRKVITHNSPPWLESIRDELFIAKRDRRQKERKWRNTKFSRTCTDRQSTRSQNLCTQLNINSTLKE